MAIEDSIFFYMESVNELDACFQDNPQRPIRKLTPWAWYLFFSLLFYIHTWSYHLTDLLRRRFVGTRGARNHARSSYSQWVLSLIRVSTQDFSIANGTRLQISSRGLLRKNGYYFCNKPLLGWHSWCSTLNQRVLWKGEVGPGRSQFLLCQPCPFQCYRQNNDWRWAFIRQ